MISPTSPNFNKYTEEDWLAILPFLTKEERDYIERVVASRMAIWEPLSGPQTMALQSLADVIGYGGAAGGGKTDLMCGKMLTQHTRGLIVRREATQLTGITDRFTELLGGTLGYNGQKNIWRLARPKVRAKQIEFGSTPHVDDWNKYQGRPRDFLGVDEAANFLELQVRSLIGWVRSVDPKQRCQSLLAFNPPTTIEGRWIVDYFAPWLDDKYPNPAEPGELRYFATVNGKEVEVPDGRTFVLFRGKEPLYDFDPSEYMPTEIIKPMSRTFIPSKITDNPYLLGTGYMSQLQALPEPLRSQMLNGDFKAGMTADPWQVLPTAWVELAMARWKPMERKTEMLSLGCDVARGGKDKTIVARRHKDWWFDELLTFPGSETPDGPQVASYVIGASRDRTPQHVDVIGVGASPYDFLVQANQPAVGVDVRNKSLVTDKSGLLTFYNLRSELWWKFRELLDPTNNYGVALPPDKELKAELCTPKWKSVGREIQVQSREEIIDNLKRSVDKATAVILAAIETPKLEHVSGQGDGTRNSGNRPYDPYENF
jgi:hypothetical protein